MLGKKGSKFDPFARMDLVYIGQSKGMKLVQIELVCEI
jgi:hypothetical protein